MCHLYRIITWEIDALIPNSQLLDHIWTWIRKHCWISDYRTALLVLAQFSHFICGCHSNSTLTVEIPSVLKHFEFCICNHKFKKSWTLIPSHACEYGSRPKSDLITVIDRPLEQYNVVFCDNVVLFDAWIKGTTLINIYIQ